VATVFVLLGVLAVVAALWSQRMNSIAASWPFVPGVITRSELESALDDTSVRIEYEYTVDGKTYRSAQFSFATMSNVASHKEGRVKRYPVGRRVPVFFDPINPARAVVERNPSSASLWLGLGGLAMIALAFSL
jgi:hypothetical protein